MSESVLSSFNQQSFQAQLGNVAQANNFAAIITLPSALQTLVNKGDRFPRKIAYAIRATEVPESRIGEITLPFRAGTKFRIPGDRDFTATWSVTCRYDVDGVVYDCLEAWHDSIVGHVNADTLGDDEDVLSLMGSGEIYQLSRNGRILKSWALANVWINHLGGPSYDWSSDNAIVEVPATFTFQHKETNVTRNNVISEVEAIASALVT